MSAANRLLREQSRRAGRPLLSIIHKLLRDVLINVAGLRGHLRRRCEEGEAQTAASDRIHRLIKGRLVLNSQERV